MSRFTMTPHAARQAQTRQIEPLWVADIVDERMEPANDVVAKKYSWAILVGFTEDRGSLIGSNGDQIWAILRDCVITTVMLRRSNQPHTPAALRVDRVIY